MKKKPIIEVENIEDLDYSQEIEFLLEEEQQHEQDESRTG
jgi:hypothetical protein